MKKLIEYFRTAHLILITEKTAQRLAVTVHNMRGIDSFIQLGVTGSDVSALLPRRIDATLGELRGVLAGRRGVA